MLNRECVKSSPPVGIRPTRFSFFAAGYAFTRREFAETSVTVVTSWVHPKSDLKKPRWVLVNILLMISTIQANEAKILSRPIQQRRNLACIRECSDKESQIDVFDMIDELPHLSVSYWQNRSHVHWSNDREMKITQPINHSDRKINKSDTGHWRLFSLKLLKIEQDLRKHVNLDSFSVSVVSVRSFDVVFRLEWCRLRKIRLRSSSSLFGSSCVSAVVIRATTVGNGLPRNSLNASDNSLKPTRSVLTLISSFRRQYGKRVYRLRTLKSCSVLPNRNHWLPM